LGFKQTAIINLLIRYFFSNSTTEILYGSYLQKNITFSVSCDLIFVLTSFRAAILLLYP
jgi:hypothetical protein